MNAAPLKLEDLVRKPMLPRVTASKQDARHCRLFENIFVISLLRYLLVPIKSRAAAVRDALRHKCDEIRRFHATKKSPREAGFLSCSSSV
jgi:hypothetical protein